MVVLKYLLLGLVPNTALIALLCSFHFLLEVSVRGVVQLFGRVSVWKQ